MQKRISILCMMAGLLLLSACADTYDIRLEKGFEFFEQEKYPQAIELLQEVLQDDPENIDALLLLQAVLCEVGNFEQSIAHGKAVLKIDPNIQAYQNLAYAYRRLERNEDAIRSYKSLLARSPENEGANELLGLTLAGQSRYEEAIEPLAKALRLKGEDTLLLQTLGICNMRLQQYEEAIDAFERIIKTEETPELLAKARLKIGDVYYTMGDYGKAIEQYAMIALEQDQSTYHLAQHYIKALNRVPDDKKRKIINGVPVPSWNYNLNTLGTCGSATLKIALNFLNDSVSRKSIAEAVKDDDGSTPYALWNFVVERGHKAYLGKANISNIKYWINRGYPVLVLILEPEYGWGHFILVVGYDEFKDVLIIHDVNHWIEEREMPTRDFQHAWNYYDRTALFIFHKSVDLPHNFEADIYAQNCLQTYKGLFLFYLDREGSLRELKNAVWNQPPLPGTYALLARIYADDPSKNARADQYLLTALTMGPSNGFTLLNAGVFYKIRNENAKALSVFKKGLGFYPRAYELRQKLASVYIKLRDHANAAIELEKLKKQCNRTTYCRDQKQINNDLFMSYLFLEDYGKAIEANQELIGLSSTSKEKFQALGKHAGLGILNKQPEVVRESLRQVLDLLPEDDPKRQGWKDLLRAMDKKGMRVDVKLEKDTERGQVKFVEFYAIKSDAVADSVAPVH